MKAKERRPRLQTAARTVELLLAVAREPQGATVKDLTEAMKIHRQVVYNLLHTLLEMRLVRRTAEQRFLLGVGVLPIVNAFERSLAIHHQLLPLVQTIARETGETAYAVGWLDDEIVVMETARGTHPVHVAEVSLGYSGFAHARASGKLLLACANVEQRRSYLANHPLEGRTPQTIISSAALEKELETIRQRGFAQEHEEFLEGLCCVALPVPHTNGSLCVGLSAPRERYFEKVSEYIRQIQVSLSLQ